jgi:hypothetical protein
MYATRSKEATMKHLFVLAAVLAAALLGGVAACGGEDRLPRDELGARLQSIGERGGALWGRLEQQAQNVEPGEPLSAGVEQALADLIEFQAEAADELDGLNPPADAADSITLLIAALRERTETLQRVLQADVFTEQDSERVTRAGEKIDQAFEQLSEDNFLTLADDHGE